MKKTVRLKYAAAFCLLLCVEVLIALFVRDGFVRPFLGDVLVVLLLYCLVRTIWRRVPRLLPLWLFLFAAMVEVSQALHLVQRLGLENYPLLRTVLGSTFDPLDLVCYGAGAVLLFVWQAVETRRSSQSPSGESRPSRE